MALNDKLINYGNLAEFHSQILNDTGTTTGSTWSSDKINTELSGKQATLVAGSGITISGNTISATGGGGSVDLLEEVTYAQLKSLRDNSQLVPGQQYRITDYVTTTAQANTQSDGHQFDIIVVADSEDKLNENARAIQHVFDTSGLTTYYKWLYDYTGESWLLSEASSYTNQVAGTCDISPMDGKNYYTTSYPIVGTIDENGDEPYMPGSLHRKAILFTEGNDLYYGDYIDEEKWNSWEESKQEDDPSYTPQPYPEWFIGKYFLDNTDTFTYDGTYTEGVDTHFDNSKLESWELKYCLDNDTNRFSWAQPSGKGVIYYMKDEWNNQVYFDFKNIKLYSNQYNEYAFIFGSLDYNPLTVDGTIKGASNNNIVERQISNGVLSIDTSTFLFDKVGYQNIVEGASYTAGTNIQINNGVISATDTKYTAGANIQINNGVISATDTKYTAGANIQITSGNVIKGNYSNATESASGLMSASDKAKLNGLSNYTLPTASSSTKGGVKVGSGLKITGEVLSADVTKNYIYDLIHNLTVANIPSLNDEYFTLLGLEEGDVHFCSNGLSIEYSTDKTNWISVTGIYDYDDDGNEIGTIVKHIMPGEKIYFRGNNNTYCLAGQYNDISSKIFVKNAAFDVLGNMMSLVDSTNFSQFTTMNSNNNKCFKGFFAGDNSNFKLRNTKDLILPATTLASNCYELMFGGCTNLIAAPALPATTLTSGCYNSMFRNCRSLTAAPELPATILVSNCYEEMFESCYRLNYIKCLATDISANRCTRYWTVEVFSETGTFVTPQSTNWTTGVDGIPEGWTRVNA